MKCDDCKGQTKIKRGLYHYTECGLNNVFLDNLEQRVCPGCKTTSPLIPRIEELHQIIGQAIALQGERLSGEEARYLRKHVGVKAKDWANYLRVEASTLSRWEHGTQSIGAQLDAFIRHLYFRILSERQGLKEPDRLVERIAAVEKDEKEIPGVLINLQQRKPSFTYRPQAELLAA